jgi:hypothetical protein
MITAVLAAASLASAAIGLAAPPASTGTGIQGGNVCLAASTQPGGTYRLGDIGITDTGSGPETLGIAAVPLWPGQRLYRGELPVGSSWVTFSPAATALQAGQGTSAAATLTIPAGTRPGLYIANIVAGPQASPASSGTGENAHLAGVAQTYLIFSVRAPVPSCVLPPPSGSPWATQYAPQQPQEDTVSRTWLEKQLPWVFGKHTSQPTATGTPAADTASARTPGKIQDGYVELAIFAGGVLTLIRFVGSLAKRRRRP